MEEAMMVRSLFIPHYMVQHLEDRGAGCYGGQVYGTIPFPPFLDTDNEYVVCIVHLILGLRGQFVGPVSDDHSDFSFFSRDACPV